MGASGTDSPSWCLGVSGNACVLPRRGEGDLRGLMVNQMGPTHG